MQISKKTLNPTTVQLTMTADQDWLDVVKQQVVAELGKETKVQGFRSGKAPAAMLEKAIDPKLLQSEFLEHAVQNLFVDAVTQEKLKPVAPPQVNVTKFVPFTTLEVTADVEVIGDVTLPDYKKVGVTREEPKVTAAQVTDIIKSLQGRAATRKDVDRAAKNGDEATIDFKGVDAKTKEPIAGADGNDYPLVLGSSSFIPGFEDEVVGLKAGETKTFEITFPADYGVKALQKKKVEFTITVKKVAELAEPKLDDAFAATVGPFKTVDELKKDIKRELEAQAKREAEQAFEAKLVETIAEKTKVAIPASLIDEEVDRIERDERQNVVYRGQTWQEHLDEEGVTEDEHRERNRGPAELRVKAGLVLGEIAEAEKIEVTPEELEIRLQLLKGQYAADARMMEELDKPENRRDIMSRLLTEKTLDKLKSYNN